MTIVFTHTAVVVTSSLLGTSCLPPPRTRVRSKTRPQLRGAKQAPLRFATLFFVLSRALFYELLSYAPTLQKQVPATTSRGMYDPALLHPESTTCTPTVLVLIPCETALEGEFFPELPVHDHHDAGLAGPHASRLRWLHAKERGSWPNSL